MLVPAISVAQVSHRFGERLALNEVSFDVAPGEIFGLLGPNGGGKSTLFRLMATLLGVQQGQIRALGEDVAAAPAQVRRLLGVTFQSPSLDGKLTVLENLRHQGHLYGLTGADLEQRIQSGLTRFALTDRGRDYVDKLSGGLKRRVELAKCLLHRPAILLLDEPSTGLDPAARRELWEQLQGVRREFGTTILVSTHLMDEAERCDRLGLLDTGKLVALGTPDELRATIGGDCLTIQTADRAGLAAQIRDRFNVPVQDVDETLRIEQTNGHDLLRELVTAFPEAIRSISLAKPTLEDVFITRTGHRLTDDTAAPAPGRRKH